MNKELKATSLINKMYQHQWRKDTIEKRNAINCAIIAVNEVINHLPVGFDRLEWIEVKNILKKRLKFIS